MMAHAGKVRDRGARDRSDSGMTLMELAVSLLLVSIIIMVVSNVVAFVNTSATAQGVTVGALQRAQTATDAVQWALQAAVTVPPTGSPFVTADANDATFSASLDNPNGPDQVVIAVTGGSGQPYLLTVSETSPNAGSSPNFIYTDGVVKQPVANLPIEYSVTPTLPIFTYYDSSGNTLAPPGSNAAGLAAIASVGVTITVPAPGRAAVPTTISDRIYLDHAGYIAGVS